MKKTILVIFIFCATAAFCQSGSMGSALQNEPVIFEIPGHTLHASLRPLASPQYLNEPSDSTYAHGVQPLWEFPVREETVSLGDVARQLRQQHLLAKKAEKVFSDQH